MKIYPDCIPCILKMSLSCIRRVTTDPSKEKELLEKICQIPSLQGKHWNITSAEVVEQVFRIIKTHSNNDDPYLQDKVALNKRLLGIYSELKEIVRHSKDPFETALKLCIIGNSMDAMVTDDPTELAEGMKKKISSLHLPYPDNKELLKRLESSNKVVFFADNAGEIVLDKLFIQTLKEMRSIDFACVVRSEPTLTDVTSRDAQFVTIAEVASIVENGIKGPLPGTILRRCSSQVRNLVAEADLVISKGGGNFETLSEENLGSVPCTFLLVSKCRVYSERFGSPIDQPIVYNMIL